MAKTIRIANIDFNANFFNSYIKTIFGESFAHSSLSFEKVFTEGKIYSKKLQEFASLENSEYALTLDQGNEEDLKLLAQRFKEVEDALVYLGMPREKTIIDDEIFIPGAVDFKEYFQGAIRPFRSITEYNIAKENNLLTGKNYENETMASRVKLLHHLITEKVKADQSAYNLKKGNNEAFAYAISLPTLNIKDIIDINAMVNNESGTHTGFKTSNNDIFNASFTPCPKEQVPYRMQELLYNYTHEWAKEIPEFKEGTSSSEEKDNYLKAICEREAKFHIEFERIHPFEDGNGRTGRIILNKNLIANELAPILITPEMRSIYISCINNQDYKQLGNLIFILSSITLNEMVAYYRKVKRINPDQLHINPNHKQKISGIKNLEIANPQEDAKKRMFPKKSSFEDDVKIYTIGQNKRGK